MNEFSKISIKDVVYTVNDKTKLAKPANEGEAGQILTKTDTGIEWQDVPKQEYQEYREGEGINIDNFTVSADFNVVAKKSDIPQYTAGNGIRIGADNVVSIDGSAGPEYTAFEVFAHNYEISGFLKHENQSKTDPKYLNRVWVPDLGAYLCDNGAYGISSYNVTYLKIAANYTHSFIIRTECTDPSESNIIVDWGDGVQSVLSGEADPSVQKFEDGYFYLAHTYNLAEGEGGRFIVKIYGDTYYGLQYNQSANNLICRIFDEDLPIASNVYNLASFCVGAKYLTRVNLARCAALRNIKNLYNIFQSCINLQILDGPLYAPVVKPNAPPRCNTTRNLQRCMWAIPADCNDIGSIFKDNYNLKMNILDLLPLKGFTQSSINVNSLFMNDKSLHLGYTQEEYDAEVAKAQAGEENTLADMESTIQENANKLGALLWNNGNITWKNTSTCFQGCSDMICKYVPTSWGGTSTEAVNPVVTKTAEQRIADLEAKVEQLMSALTTLSDTQV